VADTAAGSRQLQRGGLSAATLHQHGAALPQDAI